MAVAVKRRQLDEGDRRSCVGAVGLKHRMRQWRREKKVVLSVDPDLGDAGIGAKASYIGNQAVFPAANLTWGERPAAAREIEDTYNATRRVVGDAESAQTTP